ncbi:WxL domain-containing protein [Enterococcus faecium]|uniref:WxL domain-containing protein n=1 Tax=Enterococcus faecium TaxID=1352 RepID=UPI0010FC0609|nr:WxL domain-containing protein [Enterococcus faecium]QCS45672.1 WxL domain-containing protein [Enterococcus faecium]
MKKLFTFIMGTSLLSGSMIGTSVFAEELVGKEANSNATVSFIAGDDPTNPLNPVDPDQPLDPTNPSDPADPNNNGTGQNGPLSIDYVSNIVFGNKKISGVNQTYENTNTNPYLQVTDKRGNGKGWAVMVAASQFEGKNEEDKMEVLKGASISFKGGVVKSQSTNNATAPIASDITLNNADPKPILNAASDSGQGTWLDVYPDHSQISLTVPGGVAKTGIEYSSTLTWTLLDTPK